MAIQWRNWTRSDWKRAPGKARNYVNKQTGARISRRQYDEHYGSAAAFRTYERKAAHKASEFEAPLRPARGRASALKLSQKERERIALDRREAAAQKKITEAISRKQTRKLRVPKSVSSKSFPAKRLGRTFQLPIDRGAIEAFRQTVQRWGNAHGYFVGVDFIDTRTGHVGAFAVFGLRSLSKSFSERDMHNLLQSITSKNYIEAFGAFMYVGLKIEYARRRGYKK